MMKNGLIPVIEIKTAHWSESFTAKITSDLSEYTTPI